LLPPLDRLIITNVQVLFRAPHSDGVIMFRTAVATLLAIVLVDAAYGQASTDHVKIDVTRADLQIIGQGIMKLPYETAAPLLIELQNQLQAQIQKGDGLPAPAPVAKSEAPAKK
jgi:hypothetical protein